MKRSHIFFVLSVWYVGLASGCFLWLSSVHAQSNPSSITLAAVKGASTDELQQNAMLPQLAKYPVLDQTKLPKIYAKQYALYNPESGKFVATSGPMEPVPVASTTKLMTVLLASKHADFSDTITVSQEAVDQPAESSMMGIHTGETISIDNLVYGAMLVSGNDAAYALGEYIGGKLLGSETATPEEKVARFVEEMNKEAAALGMTQTAFKDPVGINDEGRSTAMDMAKLVTENEKNAELSKIMTTALITVYDENGRYRYDLRNSNRFVTDYQYAGVLAGKTGYTDAAGHCLITTVKQNGNTLVAVILHTISETNDASAVEARRLIDAGFSLTQWN